MAELIKRIKQESDWISFKLETDLIDPPVLKLKVIPLNRMLNINYLAEMGQKKNRISRVLIDLILDSIKEWDLTQNGKPIPVTEENKRACLVSLLGEQVKGEDKTLLGFELFNYVADQRNFEEKNHPKKEKKPKPKKEES